jgi:hypothetical protein
MSRQKAKFLETRTVPETAPKATLVGAHGLKVKNLDAPEFSGNIRDYPSNYQFDSLLRCMNYQGQLKVIVERPLVLLPGYIV